MAERGPHWLAGPVGFRQTEQGDGKDRRIAFCKWDFVGASASGEIRRYSLHYSVKTRNFTSAPLVVTPWEKQNSKALLDLYRPIAVLRHMLPKGHMAGAMKAMLTPEQVAAAMAVSILGGKNVGDNS